MPFLASQQSRLLGGRSGLAVPVPTYGAEIVTNGDMELDASWANTASAPAINERSNTQAQAGTYSRHVVSGGSGERGVQQGLTWTVGAWYLLNGWIYKTAGTYAYFSSTPFPAVTVTGNGAWTQRLLVGRATLTNHNLIALTASNGEAYFDSVSVKPIVLASMFSTRALAFTDAIIKAKATIVAATRAGVVGWLDSATTPANFLVAHHNGTNAMLTKCVGGLYTPLIDTAATYVAGAYVEIRRTASTNTFALYYNGSKVGADQTVSDAGIISNTLAGYSNTWAGNTLSDFSAVAS